MAQAPRSPDSTEGAARPEAQPAPTVAPTGKPAPTAAPPVALGQPASTAAPAGQPAAPALPAADDAISARVAAAGDRLQNPRELSDRVAMGRALWRELVIGFAAQLGELRLGFTQLAALYVLADAGTTTIADLADALNRSPSATSRLVDGLARRKLLERRPEAEDRRQRTLWLTHQGQSLLATVDHARADQFLAVVRPLPPGERALIAMGVAALATHAISRRGRLIKSPRG